MKSDFINKIGAIQTRNAVVDEGKIDHRVDLAKQVIRRNQTLERNHLKFGLLG